MHIMHTIDLTNAWEPPVAGSRIWVRRFGRPSGIEPGDRVWLVMDVPPPADATLNGVALPLLPEATGAWRIDVTARLEPRNELVVPLDADGGGVRRAALPAARGGVRLEIEVA
ncbi:MAG: hypothetical protein RLZZ21_2474 [Planctomycetota bacterium]|jgi:hypothetical protein